MQPGDIGFLSKRGDIIASLIRFAERRKYGDVAASHYNHVFMCVDVDGTIVEALPSGVTVGNVSKYAGEDFVLKTPPYAPGEAANAVAAMRASVGDGYGFLTFVSVALTLMTGTRLRFGLAGTEICSGAAADALTRANVDCGEDETFDTPADLYALVKWTA